MKTIATVTGYFTDDTQHEFTVLVDLGEWDGDENDHSIFYYMDNDPLQVGELISENFFIKTIESVATI